MFERYTERARRVLFFARYETSQRGGLTITAEHLLLGVLRERKGITHQILRDAGVSYDELVRELESCSPVRDRVATSVEIPFSHEARGILQLAADEADSLNHSYIGAEHLLLGLLRRADTPACAILGRHGMTLEGVRKQVVELAAKSDASSTDDSQVPMISQPDVPAVLDHVAAIEALLTRLVRADDPAAQSARSSVVEHLTAIRRLLR